MPTTMNIDLSKKKKTRGKAGSAAGTKKKKGGDGLALGLNRRGNVLGGGSSSSSDDSDDNDNGGDRGREPGGGGSRVAAVNRAIASEQAALRRRAVAEEEAAAAEAEANVYDYDGAYDSFSKNRPEQVDERQSDKKDGEEKKSRYIGDLLKAAERRNRERELVIERKVAREQKEEEAQQGDEFRDKGTFVTAAYKRKLQERELWQAQEEKRFREEEENDVTKKKGGALANFYGSLNKNVALGGTGAGPDGDATKDATNEKDSGAMGLGFMDGFERDAGGGGDDKVRERKTAERTAEKDDGGDGEQSARATEEDRKLTMRRIREKKVAEARVRYLRRLSARKNNGVGVIESQ